MFRALLFVSLLTIACNDSQEREHARETAHESPVPSATASEPALRGVSPDDIAGLLREQPSRVLLVNVWATWCEPCVEEFPELIHLANEYRSRGLGILFFSADPTANHEAALAFLVEQGAPMPSFVKTGSDEPFITALHPQWSGTLPATMLFDAERRPHYLWEEQVDRKTLSGPIERMLARSGSEP